MNFTQTISFHSDEPETLIELVTNWDEMQADLDVMGYTGSRLLADRDEPGKYVMVVTFGMVDPDVSAYEEAMKNNERPETQEIADRFRAASAEEPVWNNYDEVYRAY